MLLKELIVLNLRDEVDIFNSRGRGAFLPPWTFWFLYSAHFKYMSMRRTLTAIWVVFLAHKYLFYPNSDFIYCFIEHLYIRLPIFMKISSFFHILIEPNSNIAPCTFLSNLLYRRAWDKSRQFAARCKPTLFQGFLTQHVRVIRIISHHFCKRYSPPPFFSRFQNLLCGVVQSSLLSTWRPFFTSHFSWIVHFFMFMHNFSGFVDPTSWKIAVVQDFLAKYSSKSSVQTILSVRLLYVYFLAIVYLLCWCYTGYEASWQEKCVINQFQVYFASVCHPSFCLLPGIPSYWRDSCNVSSESLVERLFIIHRV